MGCNVQRRLTLRGDRTIGNTNVIDFRHCKNAIWLAALAVCCAAAVGQAASVPDDWELRPYRIQVLIALDVPGSLSEQLAAELPKYLVDRADSAIGAAWVLKVEIANGPVRHRLLSDMDTLTVEQLPEPARDTDKRLLLAVRATPRGYELSGREYDRYAERWSATLVRTCRQRAALPEQLFQLAREVVAPLAQLQLDPDDDQRVVLQLRAAKLPHRGDDLHWVKPGEMFVPIWRRTTREGEAVPGGIQEVPWTFIQAEDVADGQVVGRMYSGTRRPLGVRHRGRIELLAIAVRARPRPVVVRLQSRTNPEKPLVGYEVFVQNTGEEATRLLGRSDREGRVTVEPGDTRVQLVYAKSGGELLARVPVLPGVQTHVDVPLPDDDLRLQAEARLSALREDLIDVVARRNILITRARQAMDDGDYQQARRLLTELDQLPGRAHFSRALQSEARLHRSDDPTVQKRIDNLFAATQVLLAQFLDVRSVTDLQDELREAQREGS